MKIEQLVFQSKVWNFTKGFIPSSIRGFLSNSLLTMKRWRGVLDCFFLMPRYVKNWPSSIAKELLLPKGSHIEYLMRNSFLQNDHLKLTIRAKSYDKFIVQEIYTGSYGIALKELPKSPTIIDAGAHIGVFATKVMKEFAEACLFCVEPITENLTLLSKNLSDNGFNKNVTVIKELLSKDGGLKTIYERKNHSAGFNVYMKTETKYEIKSRTLESIFQEFNIAQCDLLKMDIEGGEYEVLFNTPEYVFQKIKNIVMEYHPFPKETADIKALSDFLSKKGYSLNFYSKKMLYASR